MPIKIFSDLDFRKTQLKDVRLDNITNENLLTGLGEIAFDTISDNIKYKDSLGIATIASRDWVLDQSFGGGGGVDLLNGNGTTFVDYGTAGQVNLGGALSQNTILSGNYNLLIGNIVDNGYKFQIGGGLYANAGTSGNTLRFDNSQLFFESPSHNSNFKIDIDGRITATAGVNSNRHLITHNNSNNVGGIVSFQGVDGYVIIGDSSTEHNANAFHEAVTGHVNTSSDYFRGTRTLTTSVSPSTPMHELGQHPLYGFGSSHDYGLYEWDGTTRSPIWMVTPTTRLFGIGLRTATAKLHIRGNGAASGELFRLDDTNSVNKLLVTDSGNFYANAGTAGQAFLQLTTSGATFNKPVNYLQDYSSQYVDRSFVDKAYVDAIASGLDPKESVRVATTGFITLSGLQTIDGVTVIAGDRVLVKNQGTAGISNGIYTASSAGWTRSTDFDGTPSNEINAGAYTFVTEGTTYQDTGWVLATNDPIILGTTSLNFVQFSGGGGGIINTAANTELMMSDGTNAVPSGVFADAAGNFNLGTSLAGATRTISATGSATNVGLILDTKGVGNIRLQNAGVTGLTIQGSGVYSTNNGFIVVQGSSGYFEGSNLTTISLGGSGGSSQLNIKTGNSNTGTSAPGNIFISPGNVFASSGSSSGSISLSTTAPDGAGAEGAVNIQTRAAGRLGFFNATAVTKRSAASDLQTFYNGMVDYGFFPAATLSGGGGAALSSLTAATSSNNINNANNSQTWTWNTFSGLTPGLNISSNTTSISSSASALFSIDYTGTQAASVTYAANISNTRTSSGGVNTGLLLNSTGADFNHAIQIINGNIQINNTTTSFITGGGAALPVLKFTANASAVNEITLANSATGQGVTVSATGTDTNIGININAKGSSSAVINSKVFINSSGIATTGNTSLSANSGTLLINASSTLTIGNASFSSGVSPTINIIGNSINTAATGIGAINITGGQSNLTAIKGGNVVIQSGGATTGNADSGDIYLNIASKAGAGLEGNIGLFTSSTTFSSGQNILFIGDRLAIPISQASGGTFLYSEASNKLVTSGDIQLGNTNMGSSNRTISVAGSSSAAELTLKTQGFGQIYLASGGGVVNIGDSSIGFGNMQISANTSAPNVHLDLLPKGTNDLRIFTTTTGITSIQQSTTATNNNINVASINRVTSGTSAAGFGISFAFGLTNVGSSNTVVDVAKIKTTLTSAGNSDMTMTTYRSSTLTDGLTLVSTGQLRLPAYTTTSSFTGTAIGNLQFDSSGNILTSALGSNIQSFTVTLSTAQILTSNTSPITLIPAQGAGIAIIPIGAWTMKLIFGSAAFATNTTYRYQYNGAASGIFINGNYNYGATTYDILNLSNLTSYTPASLENRAIEFFTTVGNPTNGTGTTIKISGLYITIAL